MSPSPPSPQPPPSSITLNDIYYVLFRHKWMLLAFVGAGLLAAAVMYFSIPKEYASEAKLLVRYVMDTRSMAPDEKNPDVKSPDSRGENIINSELEILTSLDLAGEVADLVGPEKILAKVGGGSNRLSAAAVVARGLTPDVPRHSSIIKIQFQHTDPTVVQPVLKQLLESYVKKHLEIHRGMGVMDDFLTQQTDKLRSDLATSEARLWELKTNAGIISVEDSKKAFNDEIMKIQDGLLSAEAELAERKATLEQIQPAKPDAAAAELGVPADKVTEYKSICERLNAARKRESEKSLTWGDDNPMLQALRGQITDAEKQKAALEGQFPKLATLNIPMPASTTPSPDAHGQSIDPMTEFARAKALEAKMKVLTAQLAKVRALAALVDQAGTEISKLQRRKDLDEASYRFYKAKSEQAKADENLGPGRITDISVVQSPSPPAPAISKKSKIVMGAFGGLIAAGLAIAFGLELFLDPRVKRPSEIESKLHIPLFLSIPRIASPRPSAPLSALGRGIKGEVSQGERGEGRGEVVPHSVDSSLTTHHSPLTPNSVISPQSSVLGPQSSELTSDPLAPYHAAIRDRLTMYFQSRNMTHKPKLVGVTSSGRHSGVTTLAAGLAASLSEMGSGNVLLVDMGIPNGLAHPFHNGKPLRPLQEALEGGSRTEALVQDNLYLATTRGNEAGSQTLAIVPAKFSALMPRLKESDYDYIIFDLPPVNSTSPTAGLASMMDMTFLVVEAERANRETVKRSLALLAVSKANVAAILNKTRNYLPAWLHSEV